MCIYIWRERLFARLLARAGRNQRETTLTALQRACASQSMPSMPFTPGKKRSVLRYVTLISVGNLRNKFKGSTLPVGVSKNKWRQSASRQAGKQASRQAGRPAQ